MDNYQKYCILFLSLCVIITASENIFTYFGLVLGIGVEIELSKYLIQYLGIEVGLITAFVLSTSISFILYAIAIKKTQNWPVWFLLLGATSLMNFLAALNDGLLLIYGSSFIDVSWRKYSILLGFVMALLIYFLNLRKTETYKK